LAVFLAGFLAEVLGLEAALAAGADLLVTFLEAPFPPFLETVFLMFLEPAAAFLGALLVVCLATLAIKKVSYHERASMNSLSAMH
jgi:hypothetical protein